MSVLTLHLVCCLYSLHSFLHAKKEKKKKKKLNSKRMLFWFAFTTKYIYMDHWDIICEPNDQLTHLEVELARFLGMCVSCWFDSWKIQFWCFSLPLLLRIVGGSWPNSLVTKFDIFAERLIEQPCEWLDLGFGQSNGFCAIWHDSTKLFWDCKLSCFQSIKLFFLFF